MSRGSGGRQLRGWDGYDPERRKWSFGVPALDIIWGGETRGDAERRVIEAIDFALWSDAQEPVPEGVEIAYLPVTIGQGAIVSQRTG